VGFEPTISACERPQTYDLDRAVNNRGLSEVSCGLSQSLQTNAGMVEVIRRLDQIGRDLVRRCSAVYSPPTTLTVSLTSAECDRSCTPISACLSIRLGGDLRNHIKPKSDYRTCRHHRHNGIAQRDVIG